MVNATSADVWAVCSQGHALTQSVAHEKLGPLQSGLFSSHAMVAQHDSRMRCIQRFTGEHMRAPLLPASHRQMVDSVKWDSH